MALSEYEKQVLEQMEAELRRQDPELASVMSSSAPDGASVPGKLRPRNIALGSVIAVVGLAVILGGVTLGYGIWAIVLGVLGFALMVVGVLFALRTVPAPEKAMGSSRQPKAPGRSTWARFIEDQQRRWDSRDDS